MSEYTDEGIRSKIEITQMRWGMTSAALVAITFLSCITYSCSDSRAKESSRIQNENLITSQQRVECVKAGGSWMPVQGVKTYNGSATPDFEMSCVSMSAQGAVIAQNSKVIETFKPQ